MTQPASYPLDLAITSAADAWYAAFGKAFLGTDLEAAVHSGQCTACGQERDDLLGPPVKGRLICTRCAPMSAKKEKREGGKAGPSENQTVLLCTDSATFAGPLQAPPDLPDGSRMIEQHGRAFLLDTLYSPPAPPFYLMVLAKNSDPILGQTRLTRHLSRFHVGGVVPVLLNQPLIRQVVDALLTAPAPHKAFKALEKIHRNLTLGPAFDYAAWEQSTADLAALTHDVPVIAGLFPESGEWPARPGDANWHFIGQLTRHQELERSTA